MIMIWHIIVLLFSLLVCGVPLLLLVEWCFPDYVHIFNREITTKTILNLVEGKKYNEAIWLIEKKRSTIENFNVIDYYTIKVREFEAQMAVGNFKSAESCIEQMDSVIKKRQQKKSIESIVPIMQDLQLVQLYYKMNNHKSVQQICYNYYRNPIKYQKKLEYFYSTSDDYKEKAKVIAKNTVNQFALIYLRSLTTSDYPKGSMLIKKEIKESNNDLQRQMDLYLNLSLCAMQADSVQDVRWCYNFLKAKLLNNKQLLENSTPKSLAYFLSLASYLHDENNAKVVLPYIEDKINHEYSKEELGFHETISYCIPYWDINGEQNKANEALEEQNKFFVDMLSQNFLFYGEEQRENIYMMYRPLLEASFIHLSMDKSYRAAKNAYNNVLFTKGLLLRSSEQILHAIEQSNNLKAKQLYNKLLDLKKEQMKCEALGGLVNKYKLTQLKTDISEIEEQLSSLCYQYRSLLAKNELSYNNIQKKLEVNEACIEFIIDSNGFYYALIGRADYKSPKVVKLIKNEELTKNLTSDIYNNKTFAKKLWSGISKHLKGINTIYYSPAGELHRISFDALPYGNSLLFDQYDMIMVSSTANIRTSSRQQFKTATIMGDVRYSATDSLLLANKVPNIRSAEGHNFLMPLDYDETNDVYQMLNKKGIATKLYTRLYASEDNLKMLSNNSTDIIHLSTHGFYDPKYSSYPMKNSGIFLAGANRRWYYNEMVGTKEDGIVTADEIATMNLSGCQLVVLSACETGLGNIDNSEGVFGLQRAFKLAGVQSILMSLWKVDNDATSLLMTTFYKEWLDTGDMNKALRKAKNVVRHEYQSPYYWSAFVLLDAF